jgi:hypothetical protein
MDAGPLLAEILRAMHRHGLEGILIGNAGAALHGAPVTTLDFDFMFRETPVNLRKLKAVSRELDAVILRPYYPVSKLYRMVNDDRGLQADFMPVIHGVRSFNSLRSRALGRILPASPCSSRLFPTSSPANAPPAGPRPRRARSAGTHAP